MQLHCQDPNSTSCKTCKEALAIFKQGHKAFRQGDGQTYLIYTDSALKVMRPLADDIAEMLLLNSIISAERLSDKWESAGIHAYQLLRKAEQCGDPFGIADAHSHLGSLYDFKAQPKEAAKHYSIALIIYNKLSPEDAERFNGSIASLKHNYGLLEFGFKHYEKAEALFKSALIIFEQRQVLSNLIACYSTLGRTELELKKIDLAKQHLHKAYQLCVDNHLEFDASLLNNLAELYRREGNYKNTLSYAESAYTICKATNNSNDLHYATTLMFEAYRAMGQYKKACDLQVEMTAALDMLEDRRTRNDLADFERLYELEKEQLQNQLLESNLHAQAKSQRLYIFILILLGLVIMGLTAFFIYIFRQSRQLEKLDRLNKQVFSILSHDLRSPIHSLSATLEILEEDTNLVIFKEEHLPFVKRKLYYVSQLLDTLLQWSQTKLNNAAPHYKVLHLESIIDEVIQVAEVSAHNKAIKLSYNVVDDLFVNADRNMLLSTLRNLVDNAIKFTPLNGTVNIDVTETDTHAWIAIQDNGIGLSPEQINALLSDRLESNNGTSGEKGMGLGWQVIKQYVSLNAGEINLDSKINEGTTVRFSLCLA